MKKEIRIFIYSLLLLSFSCSTDEDSNNNGSISVPSKLIESLSFDNETNVDSLFYDGNNRLVLRKEYLDVGQLDYNTHYQYNAANNLIRVSRIQANSTEPNSVVNYTYYANGNLQSQIITGFTSNQEYRFEYEANRIIVNRNLDDELRINLGSGNRIQSVERKDSNGQFFIVKEYIYEGDNITEVRINDGFQNFSYFFEFDDKIFPFRNFEFSLPNNLSIRKLEEAVQLSNYPFITIGNGDNNFGYLNQNNVVSCSGIASSNYSYTYNSEDYPVQITYDFLFFPSTLNITYY